jgi:hypothetical protein
MNTSALRSVEGNTLVSRAMPAVRIEVDPGLVYVGAAQLVIYEVALAELHLFATRPAPRADDGPAPEQPLRRLLWVQFEHFLDNNTYAYEYPVDQTVTFDGLEFLHDADTMDLDSKRRPDSDGAQGIALLRRNGYRVTGGGMYKRYVHLIGADKRTELMLIYLEHLDGTGLALADLQPGGPAFDRWPALTRGLHERALSSFKITQL